MRFPARRAARLVLAVAMIAIGVLHFTDPAPFVRIVPPWLPAPLWLVWISGVAEIGLGALLLVPHPRARWVARWGLVALYVAVFPANVHMAVNEVQLDPAHPMPTWVGWARLPFQVLFVLWALWVTRPRAGSSVSRARARGGRARRSCRRRGTHRAAP